MVLDKTCNIYYNVFMKQNTNNLLVITRDDKLDDSYIQAVRKQKLSNLATSIGHGLVTAVEGIVGVLEPVTTPVRLDIADHVLGTSLRAEYFDHKREAAIAHIREIVEL